MSTWYTFRMSVCLADDLEINTRDFWKMIDYRIKEFLEQKAPNHENEIYIDDVRLVRDA